MQPLCPKCRNTVEPVSSGEFARKMVPRVQTVAAALVLIISTLYFLFRQDWMIWIAAAAITIFFGIIYAVPLPQFKCDKCGWQGKL